jgi:Domain of unknown function (DUF4349)
VKPRVTQQCPTGPRLTGPQLTGPRPRPRTRVGVGVVAACIVGGLLLAGCGGRTSAMSASAERPAAATGSKGVALAPLSAGRVQARSGASGSVAIPLAAGSNIVYTATLTVRARDVAAQDANAKRIVTSVGGYVSNENSSIDPAHPALSTVNLELKIPVDSYPATLNNLATQLGTRVSLQQQAQDVTENVADERISRALRLRGVIAAECSLVRWLWWLIAGRSGVFPPRWCGPFQYARPRLFEPPAAPVFHLMMKLAQRR